MGLKTQILRALHGGAVVGVSGLAACGGGDTTVEQGSSWKFVDKDMGTTPEDQGVTPVSADMTTVPDMKPVPDMSPTQICLDPDTSYQQYPYDGWQNDYNDPTEPVIVCASPDTVECKQGDQYDREEANTFLRIAFGEDEYGECAGQPREPFITGNMTMCGPLVLNSDRCCYVMEIAFQYCLEGRPFTVEGLARLARVTERADWSEPFEIQGVEELPEELRQQIACAWAEAGTHEHASVASFAKFIMELMSLGAPRHLVDAATQAMSDESRHARDCFSIASTYAGKTLGPDIVDVKGGLSHIEDEGAILRAAIFEACIGETLAASVAQWMAPKASDEGVREVFAQIAQEEGNHAELGWQFVQWMLATRPHLIPEARACFEHAFEPAESPWALGMTQQDRTLLAHGRVSESLEDHLRRRAFHHIILPCADALFATLEPRDSAQDTQQGA